MFGFVLSQLKPSEIYILSCEKEPWPSASNLFTAKNVELLRLYPIQSVRLVSPYFFLVWRLETNADVIKNLRINNCETTVRRGSVPWWRDEFTVRYIQINGTQAPKPFETYRLLILNYSLYNDYLTMNLYSHLLTNYGDDVTAMNSLDIRQTFLLGNTFGYVSVPSSCTIYNISWASVWSTWPPRQIRSLQYYRNL